MIYELGLHLLHLKLRRVILIVVKLRLIISFNRWVVIHLKGHVHISKHVLTWDHTLLTQYIWISLSSCRVVLVFIIVVFNLLRKLKSSVSTSIYTIRQDTCASQLNVDALRFIILALIVHRHLLYISILSKAPSLSINSFLQFLLLKKFLRNGLEHEVMHLCLNLTCGFSTLISTLFHWTLWSWLAIFFFQHIVFPGSTVFGLKITLYLIASVYLYFIDRIVSIIEVFRVVKESCLEFSYILMIW